MSARHQEQQVPAPVDGRRALSRRCVLGGAGAGVVAVPLLAGCGGSSGGSGPASDGGQSPDGSSGTAKVATSDVPVDGGVILADARVVVTQPSAGDFKAFTAVCPHQGCLVNEVTDGRILCPCHGSAFSVDDGSVEQGPATSPLTEVPFSVQGDQVVLG